MSNFIFATVVTAICIALGSDGACQHAHVGSGRITNLYSLFSSGLALAAKPV